MITLEPEQGVADEEVGHLAAAVVEDAGAPVGMLALPRVGVLEEMSAVEVGEPVRIAREVGGHPVENDADAALMEPIHEGHEVVGPAVAPGGRVVAERLIAPRPVVGVLHEGEELDVGEAHGRHVVRELVGRFAVVEGAIAVIRHAPPRAQVHLVHAHGRVEGLPAHPLAEPGSVAPGVAVETLDDGGRARLVGLEAEGVRIALEGEGRARA